MSCGMNYLRRGSEEGVTQGTFKGPLHYKCTMMQGGTTTTLFYLSNGDTIKYFYNLFLSQTPRDKSPD